MTEDGDAYVLRWREQSGPPHWPKIEMTMWIDKDTYAPLKFTDHSWGKDAAGQAVRPAPTPSRSSSSRRSPRRRRTSSSWR